MSLYSGIKKNGLWLCVAVVLMGTPAVSFSVPFAGSHRLIIHEIAWAGTAASRDQQWMELYNPGSEPVSLDGWKLRCRDGRFQLALSGSVAPGDTYLLIHKDHPELPGLSADAVFEKQWSPLGERLLLLDAKDQLVDMVDRWYAGDVRTHATMQRVYPYRAGYISGSWDTSRVRYDLGYGTPGFRDTTRTTGQHLHSVYHGPNAINAYFNQRALTEYAAEGNEANHMINLEERFLNRLRKATDTIDMTIYEINLPELTDMLIRKAAEGVRIRVVVDSKEPNPEDPERVERWENARMFVELLARGADGKLGTDDDVKLFANAPIFAFKDADRRRAMGLPATVDDIPAASVMVGGTLTEGPMLLEGERREDGSYYRPGTQMHNKFIIIDGRWVWTGSMNFTITDLYGSEENKRLGILDGNTNNGLEIHSPEVAAVFRSQFEQMWGGDGDHPVPDKARFSGRKATRAEPHRVDLGDGRKVDIYFSPGYDVIPAITRYVEEHAKEKIYFAVFAWSDHALDRAIKMKWEGREGDREGTRTGFEVRGVFEFWDEWWSAAINMTARVPSETSENNPNVRWKHRPAVYRQNEPRRLHHKYMIIDADTEHNPTVITGSANWSNNANSINDENSVFIYCDRIANQYAQEFYAVYKRAGGTLDD